MSLRTNALAIALALVFPTQVLAQTPYIPPHSNDPHPPANQPSYQLQPSPFARPGVAGYPNAPFSNDPHYTRNISRPAWPKAPATPSAQFPSIPSQSLPQYTGSTPRAMRSKAARKEQKDRTISLQQCYGNWDRGTRMSRSDWETTCRRLSVNGRVAIW